MFLPELLRPHREPIHSAIVPRWIVAFDNNVLPQHPAQGIEQRDFLQSEDGRSLQDDPLSLLERREAGHGILAFHLNVAVGPRSPATRSFCRTLRPCWRSHDTPQPSAYRNKTSRTARPHRVWSTHQEREETHPGTRAPCGRP